jgi:hypothetical protein
MEYSEDRNCTLHNFMTVISVIAALDLVKRAYVHIIEKVKICFALLFFLSFDKSNELLCRSPSKELGPVRTVLRFLS